MHMREGRIADSEDLHPLGPVWCWIEAELCNRGQECPKIRGMVYFFKGGPDTALYHGLNVGFWDIKVEFLYKRLYFLEEGGDWVN